jgi:predicted HTH transcriptional regulator
VAEAIVNAVVHRDYASNASVQVMLFADRLEVWNPGELPAPLTFDGLRAPHASIPHNPLVCEPVFLARYAEKAGSGILDMIALCRQAGLPEPEFRQSDGQFVQTMWRDWLKDEVLVGFGLNERQMKAIGTLRHERRVTNSRYQELTGASRPTAKRDLDDLVRKGVLAPAGSGRGAHYVVPPKRLKNDSNDSSGGRPENGP